MTSQYDWSVGGGGHDDPQTRDVDIAYLLIGTTSLLLVRIVWPGGVRG